MNNEQPSADNQLDISHQLHTTEI